jgi:hypothetical protein
VKLKKLEKPKRILGQMKGQKEGQMREADEKMSYYEKWKQKILNTWKKY